VNERPDALAVSNRALVVYALVRRAYIEHVVNASSGDSKRIAQAEAARIEQDRWLDDHELREDVTEVEARLLAAESGTWSKDAVHDALWRKETLGVLLWSLRHLESIPPYGEEFVQEALDKAITRSGSVEQFRHLGSLREEDEIAAAWREADTWFAATEGGTGEDAALASVAVERLRALDWLRGGAAPA
jgi:hypothetical protein